MKFTLKDYQDEAVRDVLVRLRKARKRWHEDGDKHAFSLTATTGAGKTVMAAAAFEALFHGDDDFDFEADPGAVVLWFSDDPSLNEQTRFRLLEAADKLNFHDLVVVQSTFNREKFQAGKIYFLNTQKLGKKSLLVRGHVSEESDDSEEQMYLGNIRPDARSHTMWDTIQNTIEDPDLTLYLVLDEAHRGMGKASTRVQKDRSTIVKRLINGLGPTPPIPIVWGISATVERFNAAMAEASERSTLPNVVVDSTKVQESGLLKDTIVLDIPDEVGTFDTVLLRRATDKIKESTAAWANYAAEQGDGNIVKPLLVFQIPNKPDPDDIGRALDTIFERWPEVDRRAVAHVLGDHTTQIFGGHNVPYISPERVQESSWVRVLIAKDAISTGWDCPRAEVMVSFRPAKDKTHITQLMGRMVRTPLARRVPGNDRLNSVDCLLPFFDSKSVQAVADALMNGGDGDVPLPGRRVLINAEEMTPNPCVSDEVWEKFLSLPSQSLPTRGAKPIKRLTLLAHELACDGLVSNAGKQAHAAMHKVLDAARTLYADEFATARQDVLTVQGKSLIAEVKDHSIKYGDFEEEADQVVIDDAYRRAARILSPDLCRTYVDHLANRPDVDSADMEDVLLDARTDIAALGLVSKVKDFLESEADKMAKGWLNDYRVAIKGLSDERQEVFRNIKQWSTDPEDIDIAQPNSWMEPTTAREADGTEIPLPAYAQHLMCNEEGTFPSELNGWERKVLDREMNRDGFQAWYRNPARSSQDSLGIAYSEGDKFRIVRPDFIFFGENGDGTTAADIVDPHGIHFSDALPKLRGMCEYAENHAATYRRIESIAQIGDTYRVLDLTDPKVREQVAEATDAKNLFLSDVATDY